ncbi:hypothetical protein CENSYa_1316 [Cenarchaeum symbiosum A]|uniref:Uncharacterized protein n=1 Tax=Cenarchaeum symbiosum (strain A) TaxID=414004 RepID=A0RX72_CENSY|nr:hypothetical protein CENSYa_1316 [Cenarchaeum symbiosum A]
MLLIPAHAVTGQFSDSIIILDNFGMHARGEPLFIFGEITLLEPDAYLIMQVINPHGDICQIQQLSPLPDGLFISEPIPLKGRICGVTGDYEARLFYGGASTSAAFTVTTDTYPEPSAEVQEERGATLVSDKMDSLESIGGPFGGPGITLNVERGELISATSIDEIERIYRDLWLDYNIEDEVYELDPAFRPAITAMLASTDRLIDDGKLPPTEAAKIHGETYSAAFRYEIGDKQEAVERLNDVFVTLQNADPEKAVVERPPTYAELEEGLQNIMTKSGTILGEDVKEELFFIFSRGTVPLYAEELGELLGMLTEARYVDVITRKDNPLYRLVQNDWESARSSLPEKNSIEDLLESRDRVGKLYSATLLLRDLDDVSRFIDSDREENSELIQLVLDDWEGLVRGLELAGSVDDILESRGEIGRMKSVIDITSRISKVVEITRAVGSDSATEEGWADLLDRVGAASSMDEVLEIVTEFDAAMSELREKRSPVSILRFDYEKLRSLAEVQGDTGNLIKIDNALKYLKNAEEVEEGQASVSRLDRSEVLLAWASESLPGIRADLESYGKEDHISKASDILTRAKSIENLVDLSLRNSRFLPGYTNFTDSMKDRIDEARNLVIKRDLDAADSMVRSLFDEWQQVRQAYTEDPRGSAAGYNLDELKRIELRERLDDLDGATGNFYNADFAAHQSEYNGLVDDAEEAIDLGNFVDAESRIDGIGFFLEDHLALNHDGIILDIRYDVERDIWSMEGYLDKTADTRQKLFVTVYDEEKNTVSSLSFRDTKNGEFFTNWHAPADPGLYVVMLEWENAAASSVIYVPEEPRHQEESGSGDLLEVTREFEEITGFIEEFGGSRAGLSAITDVMDAVRDAIVDKDARAAERQLDALRLAIERYLPARSPEAVIDAEYSSGNLHLSGAVQKSVLFSEDIFVDIFDQRGDKAREVALKDSAGGQFGETVQVALEPGIYVAQLNYHSSVVTDFFTVN